ncbi:LysR family transcriptional regulator [Aminobacter niigataensis]|uniref:LysR family transcriptional regulator n=1 Tax=Aminobacter niigataensis TaxID=83265 RepID=UPI0024C99C6B|nr:LysR family transcriptional regulator [Aminobacter niigataensis]CAI2935590.1 D-malate degradation protein R [Aminobacter niigataensis]
MDDEMDLAELESLVATIRAGSFSGAARELGIPKSTVANRVNEMEARLGARLIERTTRQIRPTAEGSMLFRRGERLLLEARELEQALHEQSGTPRGTLRVSVPVLFEQAFMGKIAAAYLARYPKMVIEVVAEDRRVDIVGEGFDCAIRVGALDDSSAMARVFAQSQNIVVASASLVDRIGRPNSPADFTNWPTLWFGRDAPGNKNWEMTEAGRPIVVAIKPRAYLGSLHAVRAAVLDGLGAALLPDFFVSDDLKAGRVVSIASEWQCPPVPLSIVFPAHKQSSPRLRGFIELVMGSFHSRELVSGQN